MSVYARELRRRDASSDLALAGLAPNSDAICEYLVPSRDSDYATAAIEALLQTEEVRTLVLPGIYEELRLIFHYFISVLDESFYSDVGMSEDFRPEGNTTRILYTPNSCVSAH